MDRLFMLKKNFYFGRKDSVQQKQLSRVVLYLEFLH